MNGDLIDWIRVQCATRIPDSILEIEPILSSARQMFGGDTVYVRQSQRAVTRRTLQRRASKSRPLT